MARHRAFMTIWTAYLLYLHLYIALAQANRRVPSSPFQRATLGTPLQKIVVHRDTDEVFIGGTNTIFKLDKTNLDEKDSRSIGPSNTSIYCDRNNHECLQNVKSIDNEVRTLLLMYYNNPPRLVACGSANGGMCTILTLEKLLASRINYSDQKQQRFPWFGDGNSTVQFIASQRSSVAFFGSTGNFKRVLYSGFEYDGRPLEYNPPFIAARRIKPAGFHYAVENDNSVTNIFLHHNYTTTKFRTKFIYGFEHDGFSYFLMVKQIDLKSDSFNTKLGRVCQDDEKFFSYMEVPLVCDVNPVSSTNYEIATAAHLSRIGEYKYVDMDIAKENGVYEDEVLYVSFGASKAKDDLDISKGSIICGFSMKKIKEVFNRNHEECYRGNTRLRSIKSIHGEPRACMRQTETHSAPYCESGFNPFIDGYFTVDGHKLFLLENENITSLAISMQKGNGFNAQEEAIGIVGTHSGRVLKVRLEAEKILYDERPFQTHANQSLSSIEPSNAFDKAKSSIYLLSNDTVLRFPITSCAIYTDCSSCLSSGDPLKCVWCDNSCSLESQCSSRQRTDACPPEIFDFNPKSGPVDGGTEITFEGNNLGLWLPNSPNFAVNITVAGIECDPISANWLDTKGRCRTRSADNKTPHGPLRLQLKSLKRGSTKAFDIEGTTESEDVFAFLRPSVTAISPCYGPQSGGTEITIFGSNLDIGHDKFVSIGGISCKVIASTNFSLKCLTSGQPNNQLLERELNVTVSIDNFRQTLQSRSTSSGRCSNFKFRPDPIIREMRPHGSPTRGNIKIEVIGDNLDSVYSPHMTLQNPLRQGKILIANCTNTFKKKMFCMTPPLPSDLEPNESPTISDPVRYLVGFQMDNNEIWKRIGEQKPTEFQVKYYPDPKFEEYDSYKIVAGQDAEITITGDNLSNAYPVKVLLDGHPVCDDDSGSIHVFNPNTMLCAFDLNTTAFPLFSYYNVEVEWAGTRQPIGQIYLEEKDAPPKSAKVAVWVLVILCIIAVIVVIGFFYLKRKGYILKEKHGPPSHVIHFSNPSNSPNDPHTPSSTSNVYGIGGASRIRDSSEPLIPPRYHIAEDRKQLLEKDKLLYPRSLLELGDEIGQGHFGRVHRGILKLPGKTDAIYVAVKTLRDQNNGYVSDQDIDAFIKEGELMKEFKHHNVLTLIGFCFEDDGFPMVMTPYMANGDLLSYIRNENNFPLVRDLITWGVQIARGMNYLAKLKFVHRDLAARNCMLDEDLVVKVADFGLSRDVYERDYYSSDNRKQKLPIKWMAPESIERGTYTHKSDVWSFGVTLWELMTRGVCPYAAIDNWEVLNHLKAGKRMEKPSFCPDQLYNVMLRCWCMDPTARPTFEELEKEVENVITTLEQSSEIYNRRAPTHITYENVNIPEYVTQMPLYPDILAPNLNDSTNPPETSQEEDGYLRPLKSPSPTSQSTSF